MLLVNNIVYAHLGMFHFLQIIVLDMEYATNYLLDKLSETYLQLMEQVQQNSV